MKIQPDAFPEPPAFVLPKNNNKRKSDCLKEADVWCVDEVSFSVHQGAFRGLGKALFLNRSHVMDRALSDFFFLG